MYADDCILYVSGNDWDRMSVKIQPELNVLQDWFITNRLRFNVKKSKTMIFGSRNKLSRVDYSKVTYIYGSAMKFTDKYTYLGVALDKVMTLSGLLSDTKKSVLNRLSNLRKIRRYINEKTSLTIYKQTILPILDYAGFILIACNKSDRHDLQVIQNDALRTCYNVRRRDRLSISSLHKDPIYLEQRRTMQLLGLMCLHKSDPVNLQIAIRNTRGADREQFKVDRYNNCKYKNSPYYKGSELWKLLPLYIANSDWLFQFRQNFKKEYKAYFDTMY